jgi:hypothetical protein
MKKNINKITILALLTLFSAPVFGQIFNKQKKTASYYSVETECLEDKLDGSFILQAWGKGSSKSEAIDQAKRNVLNDILFNGITKGCQMRPLIIEVNGSTKYKSYVYSFFNSSVGLDITLPPVFDDIRILSSAACFSKVFNELSKSFNGNPLSPIMPLI